MTFRVYVLKSERNGQQYVGSTGKDLAERLRRHNNGDCSYTKKHRPWKVVYSETYRKRSDAVKRERVFKTGVGREELKHILATLV